jgi:hypothetical protein
MVNDIVLHSTRKSSHLEGIVVPALQLQLLVEAAVLLSTVLFFPVYGSFYGIWQEVTGSVSILLYWRHLGTRIWKASIQPDDNL